MEDQQSDDENFEPTPKKIKREWVKSYSNKAVEMMRKMGYENDKGLGKSNQGRLEPVVAVQQDGRRGFGLKLDTAELEVGQWDPEIEQLDIPEPVQWLTNQGYTASSFTLEALMSYIVRGPRKQSIDHETQFCDPAILHHILSAKTAFDDLNDSEKRRARARCNPFESIRSSIFLNRAAVKMANMDAMCDDMFTNPKDLTGKPMVGPDELLYFADICAGPGGFSEYVLFRKSWEAKGFGFTLRGSNDFKLDKFFAASPESFDPYYGVKNDGNIFDEGNQDSLNEYIRKHTPQGVHFVMADGGFSVEGQKNIQEVLSKQLYLCQFLTALKILRVNGNFVCKLFDIFTPFSVGLVYLMYKCFHQIAIIKPNSSRPANSERYLVCKYKLADTSVIETYFNTINRMLNEESDNPDTEHDVLEVFDYNELTEDEEFVRYIFDSNNQIGRKQIVGLRKIAAFAKNLELKETRQSKVRQTCLKDWRLPDKLRQAPEIKSTDCLLADMLLDWFKNHEWMDAPAVEMTSAANLSRQIHNVNDWYFIPFGRGESVNACTLFLCKSRGNLLRYTGHNRWEQVQTVFDVQPRSLFFGEIVEESFGEGRLLTRMPALHIIDGVCLGGIEIRRRSFCERYSMCQKYALSLNKPHKLERTGVIRCKPLFCLKDMNAFFNNMRYYMLKDNSQRFGLALDDNKFLVPGGVLMFCNLFENYTSQYSRTYGELYYFNMQNKESFYKNQIPPEKMQYIFASFRQCYIRRLLWKWTDTRQVHEDATDDGTGEKSNKLFRHDLVQFISKKLQSQPQPQAKVNT